ncbi:coil containing protein [Vibrio phage 2.275.O._10N.286.54.E11]|nr:coil containing protein [Vibrio phage 2.275.O._10N.286.54.E11]
MSNIFDKSFKPEEVSKLKTILDTCRVSLQHIKDIQEQMKDDIREVAEELDIKPSEINQAAKALFKEDIAAKREKHEAVEELLEIAGYDTSGPTDV